MSKMIDKITAEDRRIAAEILDDLQAVLYAAEVNLPSLGIDWRSAKATGVILIDLGAARPEIIERLVVVLRRCMRP
ncbi:hypothetical protein [Streptomyces rubellomurinus]|uniref:Uncharacterized protein n=1 Tax=Streptomyces rubellomurinus (strain ATCC 31215) TaxID=359131 RepID=A0A0F2TPY7_STRR3|nr:hypothetical protein [Streptomyces rubellomurinus]KJS63787.1 hypothetical protein VM95_00630 [Streptomyces rubellomurinus]